MRARTEGGELRVLVSLTDHDQLTSYHDFKKIIPQFLRHTVRTWTSVELNKKDQEIPAFLKQQAA
jgi:hypothetical protein